ncbi:hypothetical protein ACEPAF_2688 [Sanghuangporus sanghuang]
MEEFISLIENGTFEPVRLPPGRKPIGCRWVFKLKRKADGSVDRYKTRLVAKGFSQQPGLEFSQVFAPTAKWAALRAILAIAAFEDLELYSVDISTAFLNGEMEHDVYMNQPEGFEDYFGPGFVLKLIKSIYGLKQAGHQWHKKLDSVMKSMGFNSNPGPAYWKAAKHLCRYLQGTKDFRLTYAPDPKSSELFTTFCDADHGGNEDNRQSTSGMVVKMKTGAISWASKLQPFVTLSTTEAEYIAAVSAGQEIMWLRNLFTEFGYKFDAPSSLYIDNQSALSVANNPEHHRHMKHLDLHFYWLRDIVEAGHIKVHYLPTQTMPADIMTKALSRVKVQEMCKMLGLC